MPDVSGKLQMTDAKDTGESEAMTLEEALRIVEEYGAPDFARPRKPTEKIRPSHIQFTAARFFIAGHAVGALRMRERAVSEAACTFRNIYDGENDLAKRIHVKVGENLRALPLEKP
jgi:hypothetical protein